MTVRRQRRWCWLLVLLASACEDEREPPVREGLERVELSRGAVDELARLGQLGWAGSARTMRRAGIAEDTIVEIARFRAAGQAVFEGEAFARLRRAGLRDEALEELVRRDAPKEDLEMLLHLLRAGATETAILQRYPRR